MEIKLGDIEARYSAEGPIEMDQIASDLGLLIRAVRQLGAAAKCLPGAANYIEIVTGTDLKSMGNLPNAEELMVVLRKIIDDIDIDVAELLEGEE